MYDEPEADKALADAASKLTVVSASTAVYGTWAVFEEDGTYSEKSVVVREASVNECTCSFENVISTVSPSFSVKLPVIALRSYVISFLVVSVLV